MARQDIQAGQTQNPRLRECLKTLVPKISKDKEDRINEETTKIGYILPVLQALGWDTSSRDEVEPEFRAKGSRNPVDFALKVMRTPRLFLEAKGLGEDLGNHKCVRQVLHYAYDADVEWCVLTDGDEWRFYNSKAPVPVDEKQFRAVRLSEPGKLDEATATLSLLLARSSVQDNILSMLWAVHFVDRQVKESLQWMLESRDKRLVRLIRSRAKGLKPQEVVQSLARLNVRIDLPPVPPPSCERPVELPTRGASASENLHPRRVRRTSGVSLADLIRAGLLNAPMRLCRKYKGQMLEARLLADGNVEFQGTPYASPSTAAEVARGTVTGRRMHTNGWGFWQTEVDGGKPRTLNQTRDAYQNR
jgi:predicted type IV restriction endonuclease